MIYVPASKFLLFSIVCCYRLLSFCLVQSVFVLSTLLWLTSNGYPLLLDSNQLLVNLSLHQNKPCTLYQGVVVLCLPVAIHAQLIQNIIPFSPMHTLYIFPHDLACTYKYLNKHTVLKFFCLYKCPDTL